MHDQQSGATTAPPFDTARLVIQCCEALEDGTQIPAHCIVIGSLAIDTNNDGIPDQHKWDFTIDLTKVK